MLNFTRLNIYREWCSIACLSRYELLHTIFFLVCLSFPSAGHAAQDQNAAFIEYRIPSQQASSALMEYARQSEKQVLFPFDKIQRVMANRVHGRYGYKKALMLLLDGTGLKPDFSNGGVITVNVNDLPKQQKKGAKQGLFASFLSLFSNTIATSPISAQSDANLNLVVEEIVVTASKRPTSLQDTPIAIAVMTTKDIDSGGVRDVETLGSVVPGLNISHGSNTGVNAISLRGVSGGNVNLVGDPTVAYHVDGVYLGRQTSGNAAFYDLERIEVVKGPQGTLYGRNATAGSINIISNKPEDEIDTKVEFVAGDYARKGVRGMVNLPVSDTLAVRAVFSREVRDGYQDNGHLVEEDTMDLDETAFRMHAFYTPSKDLSILLSADYWQNKGVGGGSFRTVDPLQPLANAVPDPFTIPLNTQGARDDDAWTLSTEMNWNFGTTTLTYIGAYHDSTTDHFSDFDSLATHAGTLGLIVTGDQISHEVRLSSNDFEHLEWIAGLFYYKEDLARTLDLFIDFSGGEGLQIENFEPDYTVESQAVFGQASYHLTGDLRLTAGLRYSEDDKSNNDEQRIFTTTPEGLAPANSQEHWNSTDWKLGVDMHTSKDTMLYASVSTGFKSGGFNPATATAAVPGVDPFYEPEEIIAYAIGHKSRFLGGTLQVNSEAFYYDYTNLQLNQFVDTISLTQNAATASITGFETDITFRPNGSSKIKWVVAFLDATFDEFTALDPVTGLIQNLSDATMRAAPEFSTTLIAEYEFNVGNSFTLTPRIMFNHEGEVKLRHLEDPGALQEPNNRIDLSLSLMPESERWSVEAFVLNLEDEVAITGAGINGDNTRALSFRAPRTYGVRVHMNLSEE